MIILDTNVLVAALRSRGGQSRVIVRRVLAGELEAGVSVPLFMEYEAVLTRPEHLEAFALSAGEVELFLDGLAGLLAPIEISYLWRPQLRDAGDEMVLEAAANGCASHLITWNRADFLPAARRFRVEVVTPPEFLSGMNPLSEEDHDARQ